MGKYEYTTVLVLLNLNWLHSQPPNRCLYAVDTIDVSNLNRQFLFRQTDVGKSKADVAAKFVEKRVKDVSITPHNCKIQDKDEDFYMQFGIVVCGLDSIEARRWINSLLVNMGDESNFDSFKPLIDGGTEGKTLNTTVNMHLYLLNQDSKANLESFSLP